MNKKNEINWLIFCGAALLLFYLLVFTVMPTGSIVSQSHTGLEVETDTLTVHPVYVYLYPLVAILGLNFAFLGLKSLACTTRFFKIFSFSLVLVTGLGFGVLAVLWGTELYLNPNDAPMAAFVLPLFLFTCMAFMAFRRNNEILDTTRTRKNGRVAEQQAN